MSRRSGPWQSVVALDESVRLNYLASSPITPQENPIFTVKRMLE